MKSTTLGHIHRGTNITPCEFALSSDMAVGEDGRGVGGEGGGGEGGRLGSGGDGGGDGGSGKGGGEGGEGDGGGGVGGGGGGEHAGHCKSSAAKAALRDQAQLMMSLFSSSKDDAPCVSREKGMMR